MSKFQLLLLIQVLFLSNLTAQIEALDKLYTKIIFENIEVRDTNGQAIKEEEIFNLFYRLDTITNCFGAMKEEFTDNFYATRGWLVIRTTYELDTVERVNRNAEVQFVETWRDDIGNYRKTQKAFQVNPEVMANLAAPIVYDTSKNDERLLTQINEAWVVHKIQTGDATLFIDACLKKYSLHFKNKNNYHQSFQGEAKCETPIDIERVVQEGHYKYWEPEVSHTLTFSTGKWKTQKHKLYFANAVENSIKGVPYQIDGDQLILKPAPDYSIVLKKATRQ